VGDKSAEPIGFSASARQSDAAIALRDGGFHVCAIEYFAQIQFLWASVLERCLHAHLVFKDVDKLADSKRFCR
jgi:hypothetical protein